MSDLVSVIIPVYNVGEYVEECLNSITKQTYDNIEIIVVDDGSKDCSGTICDRFAMKDNRINVIHKNNEGLSSARNTGLIRCHGDYVVFVDSDDIVHERYIELLYKALQDSGADISICHEKTFLNGDILENEVGETYQLEGEAKWNIHMRRFYEDKARGVISWAWNKMYRKHIIAGVNFETGMFWEDVVFNARILCNHPQYVYIADKLYYYRHRDGALTARLDRNLLYSVNTEEVMWELWEKKFAEEDVAFRYATYSLNKLCMGYAVGKIHKFDNEVEEIRRVLIKRYKECYTKIPFCKGKVTIWLAVNMPWVYVAIKKIRRSDSY